MTKHNKVILSKILIILLIIICLCGVLYFTIDLVIRKNHANENNSIKSSLNDNIEVSENPQDKDALRIKIDFDALKSINDDVVGYVKVNNTGIDYVVVQGEDNDYYLNHNFEKEWNVAGWVFADFRNRFDGSDKNIIIYGHNISDGSMFGSLEKVLSAEWYEDQNNHEILLVTEDGEYKYRVFSVYSIEPEDYYVSTDFASADEFRIFVKTIQERSIYKFDVDVLTEDRILTLSSCLGNGERRVVLHAKLVKD